MKLNIFEGFNNNIQKNRLISVYFQKDLWVEMDM